MVDSLVFILAIAGDMSDGRGLAARKEDLAACLTLDRISPWVTGAVVQERKPLVGELSVGHVVVSDVGLLGVAGEDGALADVADEAETESLRGDVESRGHRREAV